MKAEELMIGNEIREIETGNHFRIRTIGDDGLLQFAACGGEYHLRFFESVPLTDERLLGFGFRIENTNGGFLLWEKGNFRLLDRRLPYPATSYHKEHITEVHQLQNLYFALTALPLSINTKEKAWKANGLKQKINFLKCGKN